MKKIYFSLLIVSFLLNWLSSFAEEVDTDNSLKARTAGSDKNINENTKQKKKKGKSKIIIRPDDEDIILTLDRKADEDNEDPDKE